MIDLMGNQTFSDDELRARSMARLHAKIGYEQILAALARAVYALRGEYTPTPEKEALVTQVGQIMAAEEQEWLQEKADNALLKATIAYEQAQERLAQPLLDPADYPPVDDGQGGTMENPAITRDTEERAAQAIVNAVTPEVQALADERAAAREAA